MKNIKEITPGAYHSLAGDLVYSLELLVRWSMVAPWGLGVDLHIN